MTEERDNVYGEELPAVTGGSTGCLPKIRFGSLN